MAQKKSHNESSASADWFTEEETRAEQQVEKGTTTNGDAEIIKIRQKPKKIERPVKGLRIRLDLQHKFETLVLTEKQKNGRTGPELADEAMKLLLDKYGVKYKD